MADAAFDGGAARDELFAVVAGVEHYGDECDG